MKPLELKKHLDKMDFNKISPSVLAELYKIFDQSINKNEFSTTEIDKIQTLLNAEIEMNNLQIGLINDIKSNVKDVIGSINK